jgi:(R,R)-butanediol dehydrogenase/meso-butanediol dehydrogenase/diacetyl reductase
MESKVVVLYADRLPMKGISKPGPHQLYRNPRITVKTRQLDDLNPDDIRVEMIYAGICGTDVHLVETNPDTGYIRCSAPTEIPETGRILGHEGVGKVIASGSHVHNVRPGALVAFESIIVCHHCNECRSGRFNQCRNARLLGLERDGLFGTTVDVPALLAHDVTQYVLTDLDLKGMACLEPAGVAFVACQNSRVSTGDVVVVFGAGPIGLFSAMMARDIFGASQVHTVEPISFRRELAARWCDRTYAVEDFFENPPRSVDVIIEASGHLDNVARMFRRMNANGRIVLLARSGGALEIRDVDHMITNAVTLTGSRGHLGGAFETILSLRRNGRLSLHELVTEVVRGPEGLADILASPEKLLQENCKVLIGFQDRLGD